MGIQSERYGLLWAVEYYSSISGLVCRRSSMRCSCIRRSGHGVLRWMRRQGDIRSGVMSIMSILLHILGNVIFKPVPCLQALQASKFSIFAPLFSMQFNDAPGLKLAQSCRGSFSYYRPGISTFQ